MKKWLIPMMVLSTLVASSFVLEELLVFRGPLFDMGVESENYEEPNRELWNVYCSGYDDYANAPEVNYDNPDVIEAARSLSKMARISHYYYSGPVKAYGLSKGYNDQGRIYSDPPEEAKAVLWEDHGIVLKDFTHAFLVQLCGEFRDRASMIWAKLQWIKHLHKLPVGKQGHIDASDASNNGKGVNDVWAQVAAETYGPFIRFTKTLWYAREKVMDDNDERYVTFDTEEHGNRQQRPVPGTSVCEVKFILSQYLAPTGEHDGYQEFISVDEFNQRYNAKRYYDGNGELVEGQTFAEANCQTYQDEDYFYDFRGDSNFKPYSPESNGMIWYATSLTKHCKDTQTARTSSYKKGHMTNEECLHYFQYPFYSRFAAARAGLAAWMFHTSQFDNEFQEEGLDIVIHPHRNGSTRPFSYSIPSESNDRYTYENGFKTKWKEMMQPEPNSSGVVKASWRYPDMGFAYMSGFKRPFSDKYFGAEETNEWFAYQRLRDAVNRHTDWYSSGFDDGMGMERDQAYSPFVASSYEMSASDGFTAPGMTVKSESDGRKHWMFVFKVHKDNLYNTDTVKEHKYVDFDRMFFDETSLGTNHLADHERAWDRLGSTLEHRTAKEILEVIEDNGGAYPDGYFESRDYGYHNEHAAILYLHNIERHGTVSSDGLED